MTTPESPRSSPPDGLEYPIRVLFLCTGNSARSQIAEALLMKKGGDRFVVASAGTQPAAAVRPEAVAALAPLGVDWSAAKPKGIELVGEGEWDMVITLCDRSRESCANLPSRPVTAHWGIPDPVSADAKSARQNAFHDTVSLLSWRIDLMLALRPELLEKLVLEERLRGLSTAYPPSQDAHSTGAR
jgi:protein-tyrosine-phosphatase